MEKHEVNTLKSYVSMESIIPPDGRLTEIGKGTITDYLKLETVVIPETVTKIGPWAFAGSVLRSIILPHGLTEIGDNAFNGCRNLEYIVIPETVTKIGPMHLKGVD